MVDRPSFEFTRVRSYAPELGVSIAGAFLKHDSCRRFLLVALPGHVFFDPYTARLSDAPNVRSADVLGQLELERPARWTDLEGSDPHDYRSWWERPDEDDTKLPIPAACQGAECERTAVLLELAHNATSDESETRIEVPLHIRYMLPTVPTHLRRMPRHVSVPLSEQVDEWLPDSLAVKGMHSVQGAFDKFAATYINTLKPTIGHLSDRHYEDIDLLPLDSAPPTLVASCPPQKKLRESTYEWEPISTSDLLPSEYAHLRKPLADLLGHGTEPALYTPIEPMIALSATSTKVPVGDASLYPVVQLTTFAFVCMMSAWVLCTLRSHCR